VGTTWSAAAEPLTFVELGALGLSSWAAGAGRRRAFDFFALAMIETPLSALYSNCRGGRCLTIIGTEGAWELAQAWPDGELVVVSGAGHSSGDPGMSEAVIAATDRFAARRIHRHS